MRISDIFVLFALSFIFEGAFGWWAAAARGIEPIIFSFGAAFAAFSLNEKTGQGKRKFDIEGWMKEVKEYERNADEEKIRKA